MKKTRVNEEKSLNFMQNEVQKESKRYTLKKFKKQVEGITLIALVVTIIVLLILAGIALNLTIGQNGIFSRAQTAANTWRNAETNEQLAMGELEDWIDKYGNGEDSGNENGKLTLADVYTDDMIGNPINYSANGQIDWIILGKDNSGNVLITTPGPVTEATYTFREDGVEGWVFYEDDINTACSVYSGTVQGQAVTARGITIEDINYAVGFVNPGSEFEEYTFGKENDFANKKVNYCYPSKDAKNYRVNPNEANEDGTYPSATFANDAYAYYVDAEGKGFYEGTNGVGELDDSHLTRKENMKYIIGDKKTEYYVIASRSVFLNNEEAQFNFAFVDSNMCAINNVGDGLCYSDANGIHYYDYGGDSFPVRPVVMLPSGLEVEKQSNGTYMLK